MFWLDRNPKRVGLLKLQAAAMPLSTMRYGTRVCPHMPACRTITLRHQPVVTSSIAETRTDAVTTTE